MLGKGYTIVKSIMKAMSITQMKTVLWISMASEYIQFRFSLVEGIEEVKLSSLLHFLGN